MTRSRSRFIFLRDGLACLLLTGMVLFAASARAEDGDKPPRTDCPNIYGRWSVTHVINMKFGSANPLEDVTPWPNMLVKAQFSKTKAILTFHGNTRAVYKRRAESQGSQGYSAISKGNHDLGAHVSGDPPEGYPKDKCYLFLTDIDPQDRWSRYLLEKLD